MNIALKRRLLVLEAANPSAEPLHITRLFVCPQRGTVSAHLPDGRHLERGDDETEAAFLARVEAAR
jgi:hypothetical protein